MRSAWSCSAEAKPAEVPARRKTFRELRPEQVEERVHPERHGVRIVGQERCAEQISARGRHLDQVRPVSGGDGGIRTLDTGFSPYAPLAGECLRPLGHVSIEIGARARMLRSPGAKVATPSRNEIVPGRSPPGPIRGSRRLSLHFKHARHLDPCRRCDAGCTCARDGRRGVSHRRRRAATRGPGTGRR